MRWLLVFFLIVFQTGKNNPVSTKKVINHDYALQDLNTATLLRLKKYAIDMKAYAIKNNVNSQHYFLIDMKMASGIKRFFIYDLKNDSIVQAALVTHGSGSNNLNGNYDFSNLTGSNCTSLGKYKIGKSYYGKFGLAYKLYGLDKTNSNAYKRFVVLHAHPCVPDHEISPQRICMSLGCPTISPNFLKQLKKYIDKSTTPMLLWIIN